MIRQHGQRHRKIRLAVLILFACVSFGSLIFPKISAASFRAEAVPTPTPRKRKPRATPKPTTKPSPKATPDPELARFASFKHQIHLDMDLQCSQCHKVPTSNWDKVRAKDVAFPDVTDFPKHDSCVDCHREQFFTGKPPAICSNCHVNPGPGDSSRFPFPNPREIFDATPRGRIAESGFKVEFPHDKHIDVVSRHDSPRALRGVLFVNARVGSNEDSCKVCHSTYKPQGADKDEYIVPPPKDLGDGFWLKKGTFKSGPIGHATCFTCHSADTGIAPAPTDCATCHKTKEALPPTDFSPELAAKIGLDDRVMLLAWKRRTSAATFRHEWDSHVDLSCATCHNVLTLKTSSIKTKKVPVLSCMPCHITATTADGGVLNAEIDARRKDPKFSCVKCHVAYGKSPIPPSHAEAIVEAGK
jgi:hypothetical protein